jgi:hypothetical protein
MIGYFDLLTGRYSISLPALRNKKRDMNFCALFYADLLSLNTSVKEIHLNCNNCSFIQGNLFAVLGAILEPYRGKVYFLEMTPGIEDIAVRNGFFSSPLQGEHNPMDSTAEYKQFFRGEDKKLAEYVYCDLLNPMKISFRSNETRTEIVRSLCEVFSNAIMHGDTDRAHLCGQLYPNIANLKVTIVDIGITIHQNVTSFLGPGKTSLGSIKWALSGNNTTKKDVSGGLGLKLLIKFLKNNQGTIQIISHDAFWEAQYSGGEKISCEMLDAPFPGTIVTLSFNTNGR